MIDYATFHRLRHLRDAERLSVAQIATALELHPDTVRKWLARDQYQRRQAQRRPSKLDAHKSTVARLLAQHPYTAQQLLQRLRDGGYTGGYSILKDYVRQVRPTPAPAFLTLHFAPGQSAQVDWGSAGFLPVGHTRRALSFFVMVLCHNLRQGHTYPAGIKAPELLRQFSQQYCIIPGADLVKIIIKVPTSGPCTSPIPVEVPQVRI